MDTKKIINESKISEYIQSIDLLCNFLNKIDIVCADTEDLYGFMLNCFLSKQRYHLNTIKCLLDHGFYFDTEIIGRVMLEGSVFLLYVKENEKLPEAWRFIGYTDVSDDNPLKKRVLENYGKSFVKKKFEKQSTVNVGDDKYRKFWYDKNITEIIKQYRPNMLPFYKESSKNIHWERDSVNFYNIDDNSLTGEVNGYYVYQIFIVSIEAIIISFLMFDQYYKLNMRDEFNEVVNDYFQPALSKREKIGLPQI